MDALIGVALFLTLVTLTGDLPAWALWIRDRLR